MFKVYKLLSGHSCEGRNLEYFIKAKTSDNDTLDSGHTLRNDAFKYTLWGFFSRTYVKPDSAFSIKHMTYTNDYYRTQFAKNISTLKELVVDVDQTRLNTMPAPGKWCIGEIVDHLLITGGRYVEVLETKLNVNPESLKKGSGPYSHSLLIRLFIKVVSPEFKRKVPTIPPFVPHNHKNFDKERLLIDFESLNTRFINLIEIADKYQLDLGKIKVGNPIFPIWKMSLSGCFAINEAHQRRHFGQIERVLEAKGYN